MTKVCGKMLSEARLEKNWGTSANERTIYYKILHFWEIWKIPCVVPKFPVFPVWKIDNQIPCFPCAVATLVLNNTVRNQVVTRFKIHTKFALRLLAVRFSFTSLGLIVSFGFHMPRLLLSRGALSTILHRTGCPTRNSSFKPHISCTR